MSIVLPHSYTMIATIVSPFPMRAPLPDAVSGNEPAGRNVDGLERGGDNPSIEAALRGKTFTGTTERDTCPGAIDRLILAEYAKLNASSLSFPQKSVDRNAKQVSV